MSLEAQIELMAVPQEFVRLCNAVLTAEHGDDFLSIDDDRADAGNDGYLKSERRMFAVHCFKRVQNKSLDAEIRRKMVGDLGKARALKEEGIWPVESWTFISNYPIFQRIAAQMFEPSLQILDIASRLEALAQELKTEEGDDQGLVGTPTTEVETRSMIVTQPPGWEYLLFAGILQQGREALHFKWHDHALRIARGPHVRLTRSNEASAFLSEAFERIGRVLEPMMRGVEPDAQVRAFGEPGQPGDAGAIEHFARRIIMGYEAMLDWAAALRAVEVPPPFERLFQLAASYIDGPAEQFHAFVDDAVLQIGKVPEHLAASDDMSTPERPTSRLVINLDLIVEIDPATQRELEKETKRVRRRVRWTG